METEAKEAQILKLFRSFPTADKNISGRVVEAYLDAVDGIGLEAISRSVHQFASGNVDRNNAFLPSAAEFASNAREWQTALDQRNAPRPEQHNGLLNVDFGRGSINMIGLTEAEQDLVLKAKGLAPDGSSLAYLPVEAIRQALGTAQIGQEKRIVPQVKGW